MTKTIRLPKPRDPLQSEIDRRYAAKRGDGKRETVTAQYAAPSALRALAASVRTGMDAVVSALREGK